MDPYARIGTILDYKSKKFVGAVSVILFLLIGLTGTVIYLSLGYAEKKSNDGGDPTDICSPQRSLPERDPFDGERIMSADNTNLVSMSAYIQIFNGDHAGFIPLRLQSVSSFSDDIELLVLTADCAKLEIFYKVESDMVNINNMIWSLLSEPKTSGMPVVCRFPLFFKHYFPMKDRYACQGRLAYYCFEQAKDSLDRYYNEPVGQIVFDALEIELSGASEEIKLGKFSKSPATGGCGI